MINPMDLTGKHVLVTGASQGIGRETAVYISKLGAKVTLVARNEKNLYDTLNMLEGTDHRVYVADLKLTDKIEGFIGSIVSKEGALNGLVHCAGLGTMMPLPMTKTAFLHDLMLINFYSFVELVRCISKRKNYKESASFIGLSSAGSKLGDKSKTAYCASKGAMDAAVRCMAKELAPKHIRINTILGGFVKTEMYDIFIEKAGEEAVNSYILDKQYMGLGEPMDIASATAYLLSDASKFITGTGLVVDGGYLS